LAASRLTGGCAAGAASAGPTGSSVYSLQVTGGGAGGNSPRGGAGNSPRGSGGGSRAAAGAVQQTAYAIAAAGGDVCSCEHVLLKVLCHRCVLRIVALCPFSRCDFEVLGHQHVCSCEHVLLKVLCHRWGETSSICACLLCLLLFAEVCWVSVASLC
jgi:hypothetical protein